MPLSIKAVLAAKGLHPDAGELAKIESTWADYTELRRGLASIDTADADIAVRNIPRGDHVV